MGFLMALLDRRDRVYLPSLLVPLIVYNLALKVHDVAAASRPGEPGIARLLDLTRSDIFFNLGYALFWIGLFAVVRGGLLRRALISLFHAVAMLVVVVTTCAHGYYVETGATLDYGAVAGWISRPGELVPIIIGEAPHATWMLLLAALLYVALGPPLVTRAVERRRGRQGRRYYRAATLRLPAFLGPLALFLLALLFGFLSLPVGLNPADADTPLAKDRVANVVLTAVEEATVAQKEANTGPEEAGAGETTTGEDGGSSDAAPTAENTAAGSVLAPTPQTQKRNVVLIHLESTRAQSVTPYNKDLNTTPFLNELAGNSLVTERTHVVVPRSSKGHVAINCGIPPALFSGPEYEPGALPAPCLADLLKGQGYRTVLFQSLSNVANSGWDDDLATNTGYDEFYPAESMDTNGFQWTNTFGYEDDIMLGPSEAWLRQNGNGPFMAQYFTGTGHYGYECSSLRTGFQNFSGNEEYNRYLNCLRYLDSFVENLMDQYKRLGLYDNTIFVMYGDHGEGFREHGRYMHGDDVYEEVLQVPLLIHAPGWFEGGVEAKGLSSQNDVLPTVLEMLGFEVKNGEYPGYSLLHPLPEDRTLLSSCVAPYRCMASLKGNEKYIHYYGDQPDEIYDISKDPLEKNNLAGEYSEKELEARREDLFAWRAGVAAQYGPPPADSGSYTDPVTGEKIPS